MKINELDNLWNQLSKVPVNDDGEIENDFLHFDAGTDREDVWHWFEDQNENFSIANKMHLDANSLL